MHATWNYLAKKSKGGFVFVGLYLGMSTIIYAPIVIGWIMIKSYSFDWIDIVFIAGTAIIHVAYSLTLQLGYKVGDLSVVYPVARGIAPMLVAIFAILIYKEEPTSVTIIGIIFITISIIMFAGGINFKKSKRTWIGLIYGIMIGLIITTYTLFDKGAVSIFLVPPLLLQYGGTVGQLILLLPFLFRRRQEVVEEWQTHRREIIGVGILNPLAYILVLTVMVITPVSHVAPLREMSILIGVLMGVYFLSESFGKQRMIAAIFMVLGIVAIAIFN